MFCVPCKASSEDHGFPDGFDDLLGFIDDLQNIKIGGGDLSFLQDDVFQPVKKAFPVGRSDQNHRKRLDLVSLNEGNGFKKFIHRSKAPGKDDVGDGILDEHHLPDEEVTEAQCDVGIGVRFLLHGKFHVETDRFSPCQGGPFVGRLHGPRSSSGNDPEAVLREEPADLFGLFVNGIPRRHAGRPEDADGGMVAGEGIKAFNKLSHNMEHSPGFLSRYLVNDVLMIIRHISSLSPASYPLCFVLYPLIILHILPIVNSHCKMKGFVVGRRNSTGGAQQMKIEFLGGVGTVTGSSTLLERGSLKWLVDCGMFQGSEELEERNWDVDSYRPKELSLILLTHAHMDHCGLIPRMVNHGFRGRVVCTKATYDLCEVMLRDSGHIQEMEAEWKNRKGRRSGRKETDLLYTVKDAERSLKFFEPVRYDDIVPLTDGMEVCFRDAGHILGSAIVELWIEEGDQKKKLVFSGDLGGLGQPIVKDPAVIEEGDVLWLESTYGNRLHRSKEETVAELLGILQEAIRSRAKVIIPAFAIERTQDIIFIIGQFMRKGRIPSVPVYIDSPLAISATEIFQRNPESFDQETKDLLLGGENPLEPPEIIFTRTTEESKKINEDTKPGIIIAASGMCEAGRIKHHLKHHLWRETSHIVMIGYPGGGNPREAAGGWGEQGQNLWRGDCGEGSHSYPGRVFRPCRSKGTPLLARPFQES